MYTIKRNLQQSIVENLKPNKVVMIFGVRRVGKTVLINQIAGQFGGKKMMMNGEDYKTDCKPFKIWKPALSMAPIRKWFLWTVTSSAKNT